MSLCHSKTRVVQSRFKNEMHQCGGVMSLTSAKKCEVENYPIYVNGRINSDTHHILENLPDYADV